MIANRVGDLFKEKAMIATHSANYELLWWTVLMILAAALAFVIS